MPKKTNSVVTLAKIDSWYKSIEEKFEIVNPTNGEFRELCNAKANNNRPVYSWYNLKEAFSYDLPAWVLKRLEAKHQYKPVTALDPFVGGGTSLISLAKEGVESFGVEYNPFIAWAAKVKANWWQVSLQESSRELKKITFKLPIGRSRFKLPQLSTFHNPDYFSQTELRRLIFVLEQIENLKLSDASRDFLRLGVASVVEEISNLRKDGRALRYISGKSKMVSEVLFDVWTSNLNQVKQLLASIELNSPIHIYQGNSIDFSNLKSLTNDPVEILMHPKDLIIYSPPYLNNFDYSEIYKLELWLLNFLSTSEDWLTLRKSTVRSHHSVKFKQTSLLEEHQGTKSIADKIAGLIDSNLLIGKSRVNMPSVIKGYFDDMFSSLKHQYQLLAQGGYLVYNVANSKHGDLPIATDIIIAEIAMQVGFKPVELVVLHNRNGRTSKKHHLRESIVIMKK